MKRLRIEVPATTANLGPGFDTLGLALDITNIVHVEIDPDSTDVILTELGGEYPVGADPVDNLLCRAYCYWSDARQQPLPGARFSVENRIPVERGLGGSASCIVAGLAAAAAALDEKNSVDDRLRLAVQMEGHADNVVAATLGGMTVAYREEEQVRALHVATHLALGIALYIPDEPLQTADARKALPSSVSMADATFNLGRLAYLTTALTWGRWDCIREAMSDRLHQPYRARLIPALPAVIETALQSGAYGAALSGGGPAVIALTPLREAEGVAAAMAECARGSGWPGRALVTTVRAAGVQVSEEKAGV